MISKVLRSRAGLSTSPTSCPLSRSSLVHRTSRRLPAVCGVTGWYPMQIPAAPLCRLLRHRFGRTGHPAEPAVEASQQFHPPRLWNSPAFKDRRQIAGNRSALVRAPLPTAPFEQLQVRRERERYWDRSKFWIAAEHKTGGHSEFQDFFGLPGGRKQDSRREAWAEGRVQSWSPNRRPRITE